MAERTATLIRIGVGGALMCLLGGCPHRTERAEVPSPERADVAFEAWLGLNAGPMAPWRGPQTAAYTYVLVGDVGGHKFEGASAQIRNARRSLFELLKEVQSLQSAGGIRDAEVLRHANLFCIPTGGNRSQPVDEKNYSFDLANAYRNQFRLLLSGRPEMLTHLEHTGPFLVTTRRPLNQIAARSRGGHLEVDREAQILLIDLSEVHWRAIPTYANAFKDAVRNDDVVSSKVLTPLRPAFVSALLKLNEAIPFVADAYASVRADADKGSLDKSGTSYTP